MSIAVAPVVAVVEPEEQDEAGIDRQIRDFLMGRTNGGALLDALYGDVADEPIPERLLAVLRAVA